MKCLVISILFISAIQTTHTAEVALEIPSSNYSARELAEKVCRILHMEENQTLKTSIEELFTEKKPSPEQLKRRENIIRKISESEE